MWRKPATTIRDVFPDAQANGRLRVFTPPRTLISARAWHSAIWLMVGIGVLILVIELVGGWIDADATNRIFGGTGVAYDSKGRPHALAGSWLKSLMWGSFACALVSYLLLRMSLQGLDRGDERVDWSEYAAIRGLRKVPAATMASVGLPVFRDGRGRDYETVYEGRAGEVTVRIGATAWTTGHGKSEERHHVFFAYVQLPEAVASVFPGSSLSRFLRGISDVDFDVSGEELRLESTRLDDACNIRVMGRADEPRWRELFDPPTILGLAETYDVQWVQLGSHMAFLSGGSYHRKVPVETMDTLCHGAAWVASRYIAAARGDVPDALLASGG